MSEDIHIPKNETCSQCGGMGKLDFATIAVFVCQHCKGTGHEPKKETKK